MPRKKTSDKDAATELLGWPFRAFRGLKTHN